MCGITAVAAVLCLLNRPALAQQLNEWQILPRPERLTELYFTDHTRLPTEFTPGQLQTIAFTVHNLEHQTTEYNYTIAAKSGNIEQPLGQGTITLPHDVFQGITRAVPLPELQDNTEIWVKLRYTSTAFGDNQPSEQTQNIRYWVDRAR